MIDQSYMKPSENTSVPDSLKYIEINHYTLRDEVQKGESGSQIYISTNEQIRRHFVKPLSKIEEFVYSSWSSWRQLPYLKRKR
jgi:hypothetical protein